MKEKELVLKTPRLLLRPFEEGDMAAATELFFDKKVHESYMLPDFQSREEAERLFHRLRELSLRRDRFVYAISVNGELIGIVNDVSMEQSGIELGYALLPQYWGKGYMTEALAASIRELFCMGYDEIRAGYFEGNEASRRVMEKCGMNPMDFTEEIVYRNERQFCRYMRIVRERADR